MHEIACAARAGAAVSGALLLLAACAGPGTSTAGSGCYDPAVLEGRELAPQVQRLFDTCDANLPMAVNYLNYAKALVAADDSLDAIVSPDVKLNDLEPAGFKGLAGLKEFRRRSSEGSSYDRQVVTAMRFPAPDITDVELCTERTDRATGARRSVLVHARDRWSGGKVVERWHSIDPLPAGSCQGQARWGS